MVKRKRQSKEYDEKWNKMYKLLCKYKKKEGTTNVPLRYENDLKLGQWVSTQRQRYKACLSGKISKELWTARIKKLNDLGFEWILHPGMALNHPRRNQQWDKMFKQLCDYKLKHGHVHVPHMAKGYVRLSQWVGTQRNLYKKQMNASSNEGEMAGLIVLSNERIKRLESVGFLFSLKLKEKNNQKWDENIQALQKYKDDHNGTIQDLPHSSKLGRWIRNQRSLYHKFKDGETAHGMTEERMRRLDKVGLPSPQHAYASRSYKRKENERAAANKALIDTVTTNRRRSKKRKPSNKKNDKPKESVKRKRKSSSKKNNEPKESDDHSIASSNSSNSTSAPASASALASASASASHSEEDEEEKSNADDDDLLDFRVLLEPISSYESPSSLSSYKEEYDKLYSLKVEQSKRIIYKSEFHFTPSNGPQKIQLKVQDINLNLTFNG
jgi:hypothetical protein